MNDLRTAAQQALEALESLFTLQADDARPKRCGDAITALRAALEQPERAQAMRDAGYTRRPTLREMAEPKQPEQEPVLTINKLGSLVECSPTIAAFALPDGEFALFTHPPRREWRGLTEEEIDALWPAPICDGHNKAFARAIEAALKERNL